MNAWETTKAQWEAWIDEREPTISFDECDALDGDFREILERQPFPSASSTAPSASHSGEIVVGVPDEDQLEVGVREVGGQLEVDLEKPDERLRAVLSSGQAATANVDMTANRAPEESMEADPDPDSESMGGEEPGAERVDENAGEPEFVELEPEAEWDDEEASQAELVKAQDRAVELTAAESPEVEVLDEPFAGQSSEHERFSRREPQAPGNGHGIDPNVASARVAAAADTRRDELRDNHRTEAELKPTDLPDDELNETESTTAEPTASEPGAQPRELRSGSSKGVESPAETVRAEHHPAPAEEPAESDSASAEIEGLFVPLLIRFQEPSPHDSQELVLSPDVAAEADALLEYEDEEEEFAPELLEDDVDDYEPSAGQSMSGTLEIDTDDDESAFTPPTGKVVVQVSGDAVSDSGGSLRRPDESESAENDLPAELAGRDDEEQDESLETSLPPPMPQVVAGHKAGPGTIEIDDEDTQVLEAVEFVEAADAEVTDRRPPAPPKRGQPPPLAPPRVGPTETRALLAHLQTGEDRVAPDAWCSEVFAEHYASLGRVREDEVADAEVAFFLASTGLHPGARILDIGCGAGHHCVALARRGYRATGLDLYSSQLERARRRTSPGSPIGQELGVEIEWVEGDMRDPPVSGPFDGILCQGTTLGYFADEDNQRVIERMAALLARRGRLLIGVFNRDQVIGRLPARTWWQGHGCLVLDEAQMNYFSNRLRVRRTIVFEDGRQFEHDISVRAYTAGELLAMCQKVGLRVIEISGSRHARGRFYGATSPEILLLAERT